MTILISIFVTLIGICLGSFYACVGYRIPNKISLIKDPSFCENCKKSLKWYMNIPIFSFIFLRGKCAYCGAKINPIYFVTELITGLLFLLAYLMLSFTPLFFYAIILSSLFIIVVVSDFLYYYISDRTLILSFIFLLITSLIAFPLKVTIASLITGVILLILIYLLKLLGDMVFKKESLGGGDIKLLGIIGFSLSVIPTLQMLTSNIEFFSLLAIFTRVVPTLITIVIASFIALPFALYTLKSKKEGIIPFGPFLLGGALIILYFGTPILNFFKFLLF